MWQTTVHSFMHREDRHRCNDRPSNGSQPREKRFPCSQHHAVIRSQESPLTDHGSRYRSMRRTMTSGSTTPEGNRLIASHSEAGTTAVPSGAPTGKWWPIMGLRGFSLDGQTVRVRLV